MTYSEQQRVLTYLIFHKGLVHLTLHLPKNNITHKLLITVGSSSVFFDKFVMLMKNFHLCVEKINGFLYVRNGRMWMCCCALFIVI